MQNACGRCPIRVEESVPEMKTDKLKIKVDKSDKKAEKSKKKDKKEKKDKKSKKAKKS